MTTIKYKKNDGNGENILNLAGPLHTTSFVNLDSIIGGTGTLRHRPGAVGRATENSSFSVTSTFQKIPGSTTISTDTTNPLSSQMFEAHNNGVKIKMNGAYFCQLMFYVLYTTKSNQLNYSMFSVTDPSGTTEYTNASSYMTAFDTQNLGKTNSTSFTTAHEGGGYYFPVVKGASGSGNIKMSKMTRLDVTPITRTYGFERL